MELSFFIEEVWLASCPSPLSIFLSPPRFLLPGSPSSILPYTRRPSLLQRGNTFHNISTLCRQYCIFLYDIPDWSMNIWFSPSDSFVTNFDVSLNCHKFHISAFCSIPGNFPITGTLFGKFYLPEVLSNGSVGLYPQDWPASQIPPFLPASVVACA